MIYLRLCLPVSRPKPKQTTAIAALESKKGFTKTYLEATKKKKTKKNQLTVLCDVKQDNDMKCII